MKEDKWSKGVELHRGALERHGWQEHESAESRHRALEKSIREDGYKTTVDRLLFLQNVANRSDNRGLHRVAEEDLAFVRRWEEEHQGEEDRAREQGRQHRVEGYHKDDGEYVRPHLADNPRK